MTPEGGARMRRHALTRDIVERDTGRPAYLCSDEEWFAAAAEATDRLAKEPPPIPPSPVAEAARRASGQNPTAAEVAASIGFLNRVSNALRRGRSE